MEPLHLSAVSAGVDALLLRCRDDPHHDTVAFELLAPKLLKWLERHHLRLPLSAKVRELVEELEPQGRHEAGGAPPYGGAVPRA